MSDVTQFIESGILEMYVLGHTSADETAEVEKMAAIYDEVHKEIKDISITLEQYAQEHTKAPDPMIQPFLMAKIDYMARMKAGEAPTFPPMLQVGSKITDYAQWLDRTDLQPEGPVTDIYASIIGHTHEVTTAIVWLKDGAPAETHTKELEKFLIVEGTCDLVIENDTHKMSPGDVLIIPLHRSHHVTVTSDHPCKIILQRVAA